MNREQLEHLIRVASALTNEYEIIVTGSQSILGQFPFASDIFKKSMEADLYPLADSRKSDLIAGVLGENSYFHDSNGYYADGVDENTSVLLSDWKTRVVSIRLENSVGYCLDVHDLAISKLVANRDKDKDFVKELIKHKLLDVEKLIEFVSQISKEQSNSKVAHVEESLKRRILDAEKETALSNQFKLKR